MGGGADPRGENRAPETACGSGGQIEHQGMLAPHCIRPRARSALSQRISRTDGRGCSARETTQPFLLGEEGELHPDLYLRILREFGGQSWTTKEEYVAGPPELLAEITHSSHAIDLHAKREDYARYGVLEYLVVCLRERQLRWFDLRANQELLPKADGIVRIHTFPGLWIHGEALLAKDDRRLIDTLEQGLATAEHAAFVRRLAAFRSAEKRRAATESKKPKPRRGKGKST